VIVGSQAAGTEAPSEWLQKSGGCLSGKITLANVSIQGDAEIHRHFINSVNLRNAIMNSNEGLVGYRSFVKLVVERNILAVSIDSVSHICCIICSV